MNLSSFARVAEAGFVNFPGPCMVGHHHRSMDNRMPPDFSSLASNPRPSVSSSFNPFNVPYGYHDSSHSSSAGPVTGASMGASGPVIGSPGNGMPGIHDLLYRTLPYGFSPLSFASPAAAAAAAAAASRLCGAAAAAAKSEKSNYELQRHELASPPDAAAELSRWSSADNSTLSKHSRNILSVTGKIQICFIYQPNKLL